MSDSHKYTTFDVVQRNLASFLSRIFWAMRWKRRTVHANLRATRYWSGWQHKHPEFSQLYAKLLFSLAHELFQFLRPRLSTSHQITSRAQSLIPELRKGGILLTAHIGNWEYMGPWMRSLGIPLVASYKEMQNPYADRILRRLRGRHGNYLVPLQRNPFALRKIFAEKSLFTFLADQDYRDSAALYDFLGQPTRCNPLPDSLHQIFPSAPIYFACVVRNSHGELEMDVQRLSIDPDSSVYPAYHHALEQFIHDFPDQWAGWTHRRWLSTIPTIY